MWRIARPGYANPIKVAFRRVKFIISLLYAFIYFTMASYSDSDTSSESGYESNQESVHESDCDNEDENLEPERDAETFKNKNTLYYINNLCLYESHYGDVRASI
jgi:hypothetical protein